MVERVESVSGRGRATTCVVPCAVRGCWVDGYLDAWLAWVAYPLVVAVAVAVVLVACCSAVHAVQCCRGVVVVVVLPV